MDILRILLMVGIAIVSYLLLHQWQQDYMRPFESTQTSKNTQSPLKIDPQVTDMGSLEQKRETFSKIGSNEIPQLKMPLATSNEKQEAQDITIETDVLKFKVNLYGGDITEVKLLQYPLSVATDIPVKLLEQSQNRSYIAQSQLVGVSSHKDLDATDTERPLFFASQKDYILKEDFLEVPLFYQIAPDIKVKKIFAFKRGKYDVSIRYEVINDSNNSWSGYLLLKLIHDGKKDSNLQSTGVGLSTYLGTAFWMPEKKYNKLSFKDISKGSTNILNNNDIQGGWVAIIQHYFLSAWIPDKNQNYLYLAYPSNNQSNGTNYVIRAVSKQPIHIAPSSSKNIAAQFYVGPKIQQDLSELSDGLNLAVDYGILFFISNLLFLLLKYIYDVVGNWGWAIILLTCFVKVLFYYPSMISYRSMAKMRQLQPKLLSIRERYGDDRKQLSQEMMNLYKTEQVNPVSGCLPILLQMPVFFALYWTLLESVELRHANFIFWIKDLSVMDPYLILPLLMGATMYIQTLLNPAPPDPIQAKVMRFMPLIFTLFFLFFPSGLVLYWLTNNVLSIAQQWYVMSKYNLTTK